MSRILRVCKFATAVALLLASAPATDAQIFSDNFNAGASAQWGNERGNWAATAGVYDAQSPSTSPITYTSLPFALSDFAVELDINDVGDGGVWLRTDAAGDNGILLVTGGNGWGFSGSGGGTSLYWHVISGGSPGAILNEAANVFTNPGTQDVHLRVTAIGNTYSVFVNGSPTPATTLNDATLASGRVGLYDFSTQTFDNVAVYAIPEPTTTALLFLTISIAALRSHRRRR